MILNKNLGNKASGDDYKNIFEKKLQLKTQFHPSLIFRWNKSNLSIKNLQTIVPIAKIRFFTTNSFETNQNLDFFRDF